MTKFATLYVFESEEVSTKAHFELAKVAGENTIYSSTILDERSKEQMIKSCELMGVAIVRKLEHDKAI